MDTKHKMSDLIKFINEKATCGFISKTKNEEEGEDTKTNELKI